MRKVKIYSTGSIGNHLAQASRRMGWEVCVVDPDPEALRRMRDEIYPKRYGAWDEAIAQYRLGEEPKGGFDVVFLGTPPQVRIPLATEILKEEPRVLQCEKPIGTPDLAGLAAFWEERAKHPGVAIVNGYEYVLSKMTKGAERLLAGAAFGTPQAMDVEVREIWTGIFGAHPWLKGPQDTYLGFWTKGGGACSEHSHGVNLWQHLAHRMGLGRVTEVTASMAMVSDGVVDYDSVAYLTLRTEKGFVGRVVQDVVTDPVRMGGRIQFAGGFLELVKGATPDGDLIRWRVDGEGLEVKEESFAKKRPDDFFEEISHIADILEGKVAEKDSPISGERGLDSLLVVAAAHRSRQEGRTIHIDYAKGYGPQALS